jgi:hypothetical protein
MRLRTKLSLLLLLLALVLPAASVMLSSSAYAATNVRPHIFWKYGYAPAASGVNLLYHGGPVMAATTQAYAIFWEPKGAFVSSSYNKLLRRYFRDVGGSPLYANNKQYPDTSKQAPRGAVLANTWVDTSAYPSTPILFDADIQNEVSHAMNVNGWVPSIHHVFFVYLALNEFLCTDQSRTECSAPLGGFCAYHSAFGTTDKPVIYAAMPYDGSDLAGCYGLASSPNHDPAADAEISSTSHEQIEAATDPLGNGWYDKTGISGEIGDKCAYNYGSLRPDGSNVTWNGHRYVVQGEWDNAVSGCVLAGP